MFGPILLTGRIEERRLVVSAIGHQVQLEAIEVSQDNLGAFIVVATCDVDFKAPFRLMLNVDVPDTILKRLHPGCGNHGHHRLFGTLLPGLFNSAGYKDGQGSTLRGEQRAPAVN